MQSRDDELRQAVKAAFQKYEDTLLLLRAMLEERTSPDELVILACARLDALANLRSGPDTQRSRFASFVETFSGQKATLQKVSVPNLYWMLGREHDLLPLTMPETGRLIRNDDDTNFLQFLAATELPLSTEKVGQFLRWLSAVIQKKFRTTATQSRSKPSLISRKQFTNYVAEEIETSSTAMSALDQSTNMLLMLPRMGFSTKHDRTFESFMPFLIGQDSWTYNSLAIG
jgi:hypothetical protein